MQGQDSEKTDLFRIVVEQFVSLTDAEWSIIRQHLVYKTLGKKELFISEGDVCSHIALIISGSARYFHVKDGEIITGFFSLENEIISAYPSFLTRKPCNVFIETLEKTELILLSHQSLQELLSHPLLSFKMERFGRLIAEELICCYDERINSFIIKTPEERYIALLMKSPKIIKHIPQHYIANYLGITPVSLSRIRRRIMEPSERTMINS